MMYRPSRWLCALPVVAAALILSAPRPAGAQIPGFPTLSPAASPSPAASFQSVALAPVNLDGKALFSVTADTPAKANDRAGLVAVRLAKAVDNAGAAQALPPVSVRNVRADMVVTLGETPLLTVTQADARTQGETETQLATQWATQIEDGMQAAQRERQPGFLREAAWEAAIIAVVAALLSVAVWILAARLMGRPGYPVVALVWLVAFNRITDLFPLTRPLHSIFSQGVLRPLFIGIFVSLGAAVAARAWGFTVGKLFPPLPGTLSAEERTERNLRRRATLGTVARVSGVTLIWIVAGLIALSWIGVNLPALLASAGLIGVAIGLAAQDSMKDLVAGVNILVDDRFGVGDVITVGQHTGTVEKLNLRVTQIRNLSGNVITFPNRLIDTVVNSTLRWAQVDFAVGVAYQTNLRRAMTLLEETAETLHAEWNDRILEPPAMLGVDSFNGNDITLRLLIRTLPGDQWAVGRELRLRVKEAFDAEGIVMAYPQVPPMQPSATKPADTP